MTINKLRKSFASLFEIEITTILGCPVDCTYCPQDQLKEATRGYKKKLNLDDYERALYNIDMPVGIAWTGYSEPCYSEHLPEMLAITSNYEFPQVISTTLRGKEKSIDSVVSFANFTSFTLHLPDCDNLMRGIEVDDNYIARVKSAIRHRYEIGQADRTRIITFGKSFHPKLAKIINDAIDKGYVMAKHLKLRGQVSTRASGLDSKELKKQGLSTRSVTLEQKGNYYVCDKLKMNQPVLIPDGSLSICSFDYGFRCTYGNLFESTLSEIRGMWLAEIRDKYINGSLDPCTSCEHYISIL